MDLPVQGRGYVHLNIAQILTPNTVLILLTLCTKLEIQITEVTHIPAQTWRGMR